VAGARNRGGGAISSAGSSGSYWSSTVSGSDAGSLYFSSGSALMFSDNRAFGRSVRCLKD